MKGAAPIRSAASRIRSSGMSCAPSRMLWGDVLTEEEDVLEHEADVFAKLVQP